MDTIKLFGERNCGTRYLTALLHENTAAKVLPGGVPKKRGLLKNPRVFDSLYQVLYAHHLGWKHAFPDVAQITSFQGFSGLAVVFLVKNPYPFLWSLFNRPYHYIGEKPATFGQFLLAPWRTLRREKSELRVFDTPMDLWNAKVQAYLSAAQQLGDHSVMLRYEDLVMDPETVIHQLVSQFNLPVAGSRFINVLSSTKPDAHDYAYYRDYAGNMRWREHLKPEHLEIINRHLDFGVMQQLGYLIV
jgi:hypothetical protein